MYEYITENLINISGPFSEPVLYNPLPVADY